MASSARVESRKVLTGLAGASDLWDLGYRNCSLCGLLVRPMPENKGQTVVVMLFRKSSVEVKASAGGVKAEVKKQQDLRRCDGRVRVNETPVEDKGPKRQEQAVQQSSKLAEKWWEIGE